jgi:hypothetical protein
MWHKIAKGKILKDRAANWATLFNFIMISYLFALNTPRGVLILVVGAIIIIALSVIDYLYILPREQEIIWQKNPEWKNREKEWMVEDAGDH